MFGNLFSKKKAHKTAPEPIPTVSDETPINEPVSPSKQELDLNDSQQVIFDTLTSYESQSFPQGIIASCLQFEIGSKSDTSTDKNTDIVVHLVMPFPCQGELDEIALSLSKVMEREVRFSITLHVRPVRQSTVMSSASNIANVIAVSSGKGGVGKSTTTVNLAYALMAEGARVGILDADIYGPSIPTMLGLENKRPSANNGRMMAPLDANGVSAMSIGFLVDPSDATIWRGPMASSAFNQLFTETGWPELDYLLIDMPPGTGDIQLTLAQKIPVSAAVIVTTPQDIALMDAVKGIAMFDTVKVPVLGVIENMSYHLCENCGHQSHIFGDAGGKVMASDHETHLLGQLPLDIGIRQDADVGTSNVFENSAGELALHYRKIACNMAAQLFLQCDNASPLNATVEFMEQK